MLRILWITENYYPQKGGMAQSCDRIVSNLREANLHIDLIHFVQENRQRPIENSTNGIDLRWPLGQSPAHQLHCCWHWVEQQTEYDVIVAFGSHYAMIAAETYARWLETHLVTFVRGNDFDTGIFDVKRRNLLESTYRASSTVLCVSQDQATKINLSFPQVTTQVIPNGLNYNYWHPLPSHVKTAESLRSTNPSGKISLGLIGYLKPKKGVTLLLKAIETAGLADRLHLSIVGQVDTSILKHLEDTTSNISYHIHEEAAHHHLMPYYLACDCIAIPSYYDGMPNVLLEAGGLGVPVLASQVGGITAVIQDDYNGLLFLPGDQCALQEALIKLINCSTAQLNALGENLKKTVKSNFTHLQERDAYLECFQNMAPTTSTHCATRLTEKI